MKLSLGRIGEFLSAKGEIPRDEIVSGYSIDSRTLSPGELFFAVKGERLDGHDFVEQAIAKGAAAVVVASSQAGRFHQPGRLLLVEDTLVALQTLGACVRRVWGKPLIAVTGSAGKTTTKEAIAHLLATRYRVHKSVGNLNNHFGLPLQLLKLEPEHEIAVIEMGMNHAGEIAALARIAKPDCGVVTCVAPVHLEFFGSIKEIARAKYELIESLPAGGIAVLNADDEYVSQFGRDFHGKVILYGIQHPADVRAEQIDERGTEGSAFQIVVDGVRESARLKLLGRHNILNALAAAATALRYHVTPSEVASALATLQPAEKRGEALILRGATLINDCYNSNPAALKSMVCALHGVPAKRRIVVAGEMLELGASGEQLHRECGQFMQGKIDLLIGVRGLASVMVEAAQQAGVKAEFVATPEEAGGRLAEILQENDAVLLKASRGVRLERALDELRRTLGTVATEAKN
ncbi:MAG: UDP-N-acetylmuramoyl-tripeptide--D-alanyl-D-alanine ligase [Acidobacteriales bacterium]|nr:UDP-N-acetylmuramoyl-tripeptide--D-alanyl-D-alanine ligase [Terriglobales bacterium]